jgi:cell division protease FtsH
MWPSSTGSSRSSPNTCRNPVTSRRAHALRIVLIVGTLALLGAFARVVFAPDAPLALDWRGFTTELARGHVRDATILARSHAVTGRLSDGRRYRLEYLAGKEKDLNDLLAASPVTAKVDQQRSNPWLGVLGNVLPMLFLLAMVAYFMRQVAGRSRFGGIGKSKAKLVNKDKPDVKFADVAGLDEAVEELREVRDFLCEPARFQLLGARIPKGVLLVGPPGTGKTLLARAVAGEAGVPFFSLSGSDFVEMFVGVGAARVRDLFAQANAAAPAIIFIDEIDAVGRHRGAGVGGGHDEREQTLNQLLVEMDGFDAGRGVIMIAATNRPDILDPALLRPGRFDRQVVVDRPDLAGRSAILAVHARNKPLADGVDLEVVARRTAGFTGADLANLVNEAALLAARHGFATIGLPQLEEGIERVLAGAERRSRLISDGERRIIAYHEAGHALVGHALPNTDPVHKISIIPRGRALGYTLTLPEEDRFLARRSELNDELAMLLGGRAAEEMIFGDPTTGAQNDIERATVIARRMVCDFGMSSEIGAIHYGRRDDEVFLGRELAGSAQLSDAVASGIDREVRVLVESAHRAAREILEAHRDVLDQLAEALIARETLDADEAGEILAGVRPYDRALQLPGARRTGAVAASETNRPQPRNAQ